MFGHVRRPLLLGQPCGVELFGDLRGTPFLERVVPEHRQVARTNFTKKVVGKKSTQVFDMVVFDRRGGRIPIRITAAPLRRDDQVVGVFGIAVPLAQTASLERSPLDDLTPRQLEVVLMGFRSGVLHPQLGYRGHVGEAATADDCP